MNRVEESVPGGVRPARELLGDAETLLPPVCAQFAGALVYTNACTFGDGSFGRRLLWQHAAREVDMPSVLLGRYAEPALLDGSGPFHLAVGGFSVAEQITPGQGSVDFASVRSRAARVTQPCLLVCHPGSATWGHWLLESLPKIVLAERAYPGRFLFAVPEGVLDRALAGGYARSVLESLEAYGIATDRMFPVRPGTAYRFDTLFDVADMRVSGSGAHPGVLAAMQILAKPLPSRGRQGLTAVWRGHGGARRLANRDAIQDELRRHRAAELNASEASFLSQVVAFRDSRCVVGELGSNLAAMMYAPPEAGLLTLAPDRWDDSYFTNIMQQRSFFAADIRGVHMGAAGEIPAVAPYAVNPFHVGDALAAVADAQSGPRAAFQVAGRVMARARGGELLRLAFGQGGNVDPFLRSLFSQPEGTRRWALGPASRIVLPHDILGGWSGPGWLEVMGVAYCRPPHLVSSELSFTVNGLALGTVVVSNLTHLNVPIPERALSGAEIVLDIGHPVCPSPQVVGESADTRPLGFMFERIVFRAAC